MFLNSILSNFFFFCLMQVFWYIQVGKTVLRADIRWKRDIGVLGQVPVNFYKEAWVNTWKHTCTSYFKQTIIRQNTEFYLFSISLC